MGRKVEISGPRMMRFVEEDRGAVQADEIRLRAIRGGISVGTELALYRGSSVFLDRRFHPERRIFVPDENPWPQRFGYDWYGEVTDAGEHALLQFGDCLIGARFHLPLPHGEEQSIYLEQLAKLGVSGPLPDGFSTDHAVFISQVGIALQAIHDADIVIGDRAIVYGLGVLGLLTVQLLRISGAGMIAVVDPDKERRNLAIELGADQAWDSAEDVGIHIREICPGYDVAIEFSGNSAALHSAVRALRQSGKVVAAGFYQEGAPSLRFGEEWLHNRIEMTSSNQGWGNVHKRYPRWDRGRLREQSIDLLSQNVLDVDTLISCRCNFADLPELFSELDTGHKRILKGVIEYVEAT